MNKIKFIKAFDACVGHAKTFSYRGITLTYENRKEGFRFEPETLRIRNETFRYAPSIYPKATQEEAEASARKAIDDFHASLK